MTAKRRGVSPVIATLLLIVIAVAAAVLTYVWITGYMGKVTGTVEQTSTQQLQEKIKINAISLSSTSGSTSVTLSVANIGDTDVTISAAYVLTQGGISVCSSTSSVPIGKGTTQSVTITGCSLTSGTSYIAKAVTSKGTEATYTFTAP
jgi:flagellin-like protein